MQIETMIFIAFCAATLIAVNAVAFYWFRPLFREMDKNAEYCAVLNAQITRNIAESGRRIAQMRAQSRRNRRAAAGIGRNSRQCDRTTLLRRQRTY